jgi:hypothetical protein
MKNFIISACLLLFFSINYLHAQIENETKPYGDSIEFKINNGKKSLVQKIDENNYSKAKEIYDYVNTLNMQSNLSAFDYSENILIHLLLCDWQKLSFLFKNYSSLNTVKIYPGSINTCPELIQHVKTRSDSLSIENENSNMDEQSIALIQIILQLYQHEKPDSKYNNLLDEYHEKYDSGEYQDFTQNYLPEDVSHMTTDFIIGTGVIFTTGKLSESFNQGISFNISMDFIYKKLYSSFYFNIAGLKLQKSFVNESKQDTLYFKKDDSFFYLDGGIKAGFLFVNHDNKRFGPYLSISGSYLESNLKEEEEIDPTEFRAFSSFACGVGVTTEYIFKNKPEAHSNNYFGLKLDIAYNFMCNIHDPYFTGNLPYFNISFIYGFGKLK